MKVVCILCVIPPVIFTLALAIIWSIPGHTGRMKRKHQSLLQIYFISATIIIYSIVIARLLI